MINMLTDSGERGELLKKYLNKKIVSMKMVDNSAVLEFEDGKLKIFDGGQSCCERRWMTCDGDDLSYFNGSEFLGVEIREAPNQDYEDQYDVHDVEFLVILTSKGEQVFSNHNDHNGYYGGFWIQVSEIA